MSTEMEEREEEWKTRFNDQEIATRRNSKKLLIVSEMSSKKKREENAEQSKIPSWFGGDQAQWNEYRADRDAELQKIQATAEKNALKRLKPNHQPKTKLSRKRPST